MKAGSLKKMYEGNEGAERPSSIEKCTQILPPLAPPAYQGRTM